MGLALDARGVWAPYARALLDRCADYALALHADEVGPEHLLSTLMDDEGCAAHRAALHAFADPPTISEEARAMSAGILVTGSSVSLPFSVRCVRALRAARASAAQRADASVELVHVALAAERELDPEPRAALDAAGWSPVGVEALLGEGGSPDPTGESGHLFHRFSEQAKRALSAAAKAARAEGARSISPAHVWIACLQGGPDLARAGKISQARARLILRGHTLDLTPAEGGPLGPDESLRAFVSGLELGADTLDMLARFHSGATRELAQLLLRHKVSPALIARVRESFRDPE